MARLPQFDPVDFLVRRRFGLKFQSRNGDIYAKWKNGHPLDDDERVLTSQIELFLGEMLELAPDQLDARVAEERRRLVLEKRDEEERAERSHPFNRRPAIAGPDIFEHWSKAAYWNQEEATALLLGRDPRYVNDRTIKADHKGTAFKKSFLGLRDLISRATTARQISFSDGPGAYVIWAKSKGISVPGVLEDRLVAFGGPLRDWKSEAQSLQSRIEEIEKDDARSQVAARTDSAITRERESLLTYALRDGIEDGFLTPFKVRQMASTIDEYVYDGSDDLIAGTIQDGEAFGERDFNTRIVIRERELSRVREFMGQMDQRQKTLAFCATQDHAALVRDLINQVKTSTNPNYCHRVTANDGAVGEQHLRDFQDNDKTIPTVLTTSQKLSTGVDARNVRHIVLMRPIRSMIEFKQIIGRGTRTYEGKDFFTIWDFVKAHENFNDSEWDGEPLEPEPPNEARVPKQPADREDGEPHGSGGFEEEDGEYEQPPEKIEVRLSDGKVRSIQYIASTSYWSADGKPISAAQFLERLFGDLSKMIPDEDALRRVWSDPDNREHFLDQLLDRGYDRDRLDDMRRLIDAPDSDLFDVLSYILFTRAPKSRFERADHVRTAGMSGFEGEMRELIAGILQAYAAAGESELGTQKLGHYLTARYGSVGEGKAKLGGLGTIRGAYRTMQERLYAN